MMKEDTIKAFLERGVKEGVFPGAVLLAAMDGRVKIFLETGKRSLMPDAEPMEKNTIFDLASLTKPLGTALAVMKMIDSGTLRLDSRMEDLLPGSLPVDKRGISIRTLLCHHAGFKDWMPFYLKIFEHGIEERKSILTDLIMDEPLIHTPGHGPLYSDLGYMLLEQLIAGAACMPMHKFLHEHIFKPLSLKRTFMGGTYPCRAFSREVFAATENCPWRGRVLQGEVHDENAYAAGGYSGHSGLFSTAMEIYTVADMLRGHFMGMREDFFRPDTVKTFFTRQRFSRDSTWALGWDTPSPRGSSSGRYFSPQSVGHLGFTGTSLWMDLERDIIVILLTNRVHPDRRNEKIRHFRPRIHDHILEHLLGC